MDGKPPLQVYPLKPLHAGVSFQNFLTFGFNPFATLRWNFKFAPCASPKLLKLNQNHPSKKKKFLVKLLYNWGYDNFSNVNARVTKR